jgi:hypothetical protein
MMRVHDASVRIVARDIGQQRERNRITRIPFQLCEADYTR